MVSSRSNPINVVHKATDLYAPEYDRDIRFDDTDIGIDWPVDVGAFQLTFKDAAAPKFGTFELLD